jgi:ribosome-binding protein aMBF1 (putative translation factor)
MIINRHYNRIKKVKPEPKRMTKLEMITKILYDQKFIREAIQKGISFKELSKKYGYKFATLPRIRSKKS